LLSCSLGLFYWIVVRHAFEEDNAVLADKVAAIRAAIKQPDGVNELAQELRNPRTGEAAIYWIRIIGPDGNVVAETPGMDRTLPVFAFPTAQPTTALLPMNYSVGGKSFSVSPVTETVD